MLQDPFVTKVLDELFECANDGRDESTVTVFKGQRYYAKMGGGAKDYARDCVVLWLSKVRKCLDQLLSTKTYRFGNAFLEQESGVPIGGLYLVSFSILVAPIWNAPSMGRDGQLFGASAASPESDPNSLLQAGMLMTRCS